MSKSKVNKQFADIILFREYMKGVYQSVIAEFEQSRQVVLNYASKERLAKGEYRIQILSNGNNIGNCRIMLR